MSRINRNHTIEVIDLIVDKSKNPRFIFVRFNIQCRDCPYGGKAVAKLERNMSIEDIMYDLQKWRCQGGGRFDKTL